MEVIIRICEEKYVKNAGKATFEEALKIMLEKSLLPEFSKYDA